MRHAFALVAPKGGEMIRHQKKATKRQPTVKAHRAKPRAVPIHTGELHELILALSDRGYVRIRPFWTGVSAERGRWKFYWFTLEAVREWLSHRLPRRFYDQRP